MLFVAHGITTIDAAGAHKLGELVTKLRSAGYAVCFSGLNEDVLDALTAAGVAELVGEEHIYPTQALALAGIYARAHVGSSEAHCPLRNAAPRLTEVSLHPDGSLRDAKRHHLAVCEHIGVLRFDGPFLLASHKAIQSELITWAKKRASVRSLVFLAQGLHKLDDNEVENLRAFVHAAQEAEYLLVFSGFSDPVFDQLARRGVADEIGLENIFPSESLAIQAVFASAHAAGCDEEAKCPLRGIVPRVTELALHADGSLRDACRHGLGLCERIAAIRFDGPLNFAAVRLFEDELRAVLERRPGAKQILIAGHTLAGLDAIAVEEITRAFRHLREAGYSVWLSGLRDDVLDTLRLTGADGGAIDGIFPTQAAAIDAIYAQAHEGASEEHCPLREVVRAELRDAEKPGGREVSAKPGEVGARALTGSQ